MIHGFSASYAGHVVDDNLGLRGTPANDRWYSNDQLAEALSWSVDIAQHLDNLGYDEFWMAEHHFQPEGYECIPNLLMMGLYLATQTKRAQIRLRLQHRPHVAPPPSGRGLRHGRHPFQRTGHLRRGPRLPLPRSRNFRLPHAGRRRQP